MNRDKEYEILTMDKIAKFKKAVADGQQEEILKTMTEADLYRLLAEFTNPQYGEMTQDYKNMTEILWEYLQEMRRAKMEETHKNQILKMGDLEDVENYLDEEVIKKAFSLARSIPMEYKKNNLSIEQIVGLVEHLEHENKGVKGLFRRECYRCASDPLYEDLYDELQKEYGKIFRMVDRNSVMEFQKAVKEGTYEEILKTMTKYDKSELLALIQYDTSVVDAGKMEEILNQSIHEELEKEILSNGYTSIEEWRKYNQTDFIHNRLFPDTDDYERTSSR